MNWGFFRIHAVVAALFVAAFLVFLAECVTNLSSKDVGVEIAPETEVLECLHCGSCQAACPSNCIGENKSLCLSAITQKKGDLSEAEAKMILDNGSIWGCDICQNVCPYTKNASYTPIEYFKNDVITLLDKTTLDALSDEEFNLRPFAWRGRGVIARNLELYEKHKGGNSND